MKPIHIIPTIRRNQLDKLKFDIYLGRDCIKRLMTFDDASAYVEKKIAAVKQTYH